MKVVWNEKWVFNCRMLYLKSVCVCVCKPAFTLGAVSPENLLNSLNFSILDPNILLHTDPNVHTLG